MKTLISLIISLLFLMPVTAMADISESDSKQIDQAFAKFIQSVNAGKDEEAYSEFMLPSISDQGAALRNLVVLTKQVREYFAGPLKFETVAENQLGNQLIYRQYIVYNDKGPYVITTVMFKTSAGWKCQNIALRDVAPDDVAP